MHVGTKAAAAMGGAAVMVLLVGCVPATSASPSTVSDVIADTIERSIDVRPLVDCGTDAIDTADGAETSCTVTDPTTARAHNARIRFINPAGGDDFTVDISVADEPQ